MIDHTKCYDCGSTIPGHHTPNCDMIGHDEVGDLPRLLGTRHWIGPMPESVGDLRYCELTADEVAALRDDQ